MAAVNFYHVSSTAIMHDACVETLCEFPVTVFLFSLHPPGRADLRFF